MKFKESKALKILSYVLIPILVLIVITNCVYLLAKEEQSHQTDDETYFQSEEFLNDYMYTLRTYTRNLIYSSSNYKAITNGDIKLCYTNNDYYYGGIENLYFLILYNNVAITNVELTSQTDSYSKVKSFIENQDGKKANIISGEVNSNSEIISSKALQYFDDFNFTYYKTENNTAINNEIRTETYETSDEDEVNIYSYEPVEKSKTYYTVAISDLKMITSYNEKRAEKSYDFVNEYCALIEPYEKTLAFLTPVSATLTLLLVIYLIISIGHSKGKEKIDINDFDKIPIEFILIVACIIITLAIAFFAYIVDCFENNYNILFSTFLFAYSITYIIAMTSIVTIVKRIKAKEFINTALSLRFCKWCLTKVKDIVNTVKKYIKSITSSWKITSKVIVSVIVYILAVVFTIGVFGGFGFFIITVFSIFLSLYLFYKLSEKINCYKKLEEHLKNIYEGNHSEKLLSADFTPEFQDIITYINDISSGFENAIEEGIKSERLKTELITNVSHDIKTPLTSIINYVDLLNKEEIDNPKIKEYIEILDNKSQRLKKLTEDLVEASKASSGNVKLNIERIDICELIKQTTGEFEDKFKDKKLEIITDMPEEEIFIKADNRYMYRIIENSFSNISKYALDSSRVYIDVKKKDNKVKIEIKNISKERLNISADELMQRFVRGDRSRTTEGSGLGISISKSLTEIQKGNFNLQVDGDLFKVELEFNVV